MNAEMQEEPQELPETPKGELEQIAELIEPPETDKPHQPEQEEATDAVQETEGPETDENPTEESTATDEPPAIDYDAEIPMPEGFETKTLGELKDFYQQHQEWQQEREDWEGERTSQSNELLVARQQLLAIADHLRDVKPELVETIGHQQQAEIEQERQLLKLAIPEWDDVGTRKADRELMLETVKEYGMSEGEFNLIGKTHHVKMLRDFARLKRKAAQAAEQAKQAKPAPKQVKGQRPNNSKTAQVKRMVDKAKSGSENDKLTAISELIGD